MRKRKSQKRKRFLKDQIIKQRKWIERCDENGISYADGSRGIRIKAADVSHLRSLELELRKY